MMASVYFNQITFGLPVERFRFDALASLEERLPVVTEFVLRLVHTVGSASVASVREYFGFSDEEALAVFESMSQQGLLLLTGDTVSLSSFALSRFQESGDDYPLFSKVERREDIIDFDLIAFTPLLPKISVRSVSDNDVRVEPIAAMVSQSIEHGRNSYREHFSDIAAQGRRRGARDKVFGLYSVKDVESRGRFFAPFDVSLGIDNNGELVREMRGAFLQNPTESLEDRLSEQVSEHLATGPHRDLDVRAFTEFVDAFDDAVLPRFLTGRVFDLRGYLAEVLVAKTAKYPRGVEPLFGNLYLQHNADKIRDQIVERRRVTTGAGTLVAPLLWLKPEDPLWGRGAAFSSSLHDFNSLLNPTGDEVHVISQVDHGTKEFEASAYRVSGLKQFHFSRVDSGAGPDMGGCVEIVLYPMGFVCAMFHMPIPGASHLRAPVGFFSALPKHVDAAHRILKRMVTERRYAGIAKSGGRDGTLQPIPWHDAIPCLNQ